MYYYLRVQIIDLNLSLLYNKAGAFSWQSRDFGKQTEQLSIGAVVFN